MNHRLKISALAAVGLAAAVVLTGCTGGASSTPSDPADALTPVAGGEVVYAVGLDPVCVDPQQTNSHPGLTIARQVADSLLEQDPETGEYAGWLAESWEVDEDATEYRFVLRDDVTFSDGTALTADVVQQNIESIIGNETSSALARTPFASYESFEKISDQEFVVRFSAPNSPFLSMAADIRFAILSPATLEATSEERCAMIAGSGPFVLEKFEPQVEAIMVKREGYDWASSQRGHQGEAYLDRIVMRTVPDDSVRIGMLTSSQVTLANNVPVSLEPQVETAGFSLLPMVVPGLSNSLYPNLAVPQLADPAVREAMSLAIDRDTFAATVLSEHRPLAGNVLSTTTVGFEDRTDLFPFDQEAAISVLDEAGWAEGADGIREKDGQRLSFDVIFIAGAPDLGLQLVQQQLSQVGIELALRPLSAPDWNSERAAGTADVMWQNATRADADILYNFSSEAPANYTKIEEPRIDALVAEQRAAVDVDQRRDLVAQIQEILLEEYYAIPLDQQIQMHGVSTGLNGLAYEVSSRLSFYDAWLQQ